MRTCVLVCSNMLGGETIGNSPCKAYSHKEQRLSWMEEDALHVMILLLKRILARSERVSLVQLSVNIHVVLE